MRNIDELTVRTNKIKFLEVKIIDKKSRMKINFTIKGKQFYVKFKILNTSLTLIIYKIKLLTSLKKIKRINR